jgi:hypothetical protein
VTAATLDYIGYGSAVSFDLSDGSGATTGVGGTWTGVTSVTGSGTIGNVTGAFADDTRQSAVSGIIYGAGFSAVTGTGGNVTGVTGDFDVGTKKSSASGLDYSGFNLGVVSGSGAGATITGGNLTYTLDNSVADKGSSNGVTWTSFGNINDATGTVNFGTAGALTGNVTAATLDYSGYGGLANVNLSGTGTTGVGGSVSGVSAIVASSNLAVSGTTGGPLSITETGAGTTTTLGSGVSSLTVGGTITLTAAGMVNEGAAGVVKASTLTGSSVGATTLNGANQIAS